MTVLMERLEDGRMLFNSDGMRDYLTDFLCDATGDAARKSTPIDAPIMAMLACTIDGRRDNMIVNMVDALFDTNSKPNIRALNVVYRTIFGMELLQKGDYFYASHVKGEG